MRVKYKILDNDIKQAIVNSSIVNLQTFTTASRIIYSNNYGSPDIYIYIEIRNPQKVLGHITLHLIPTDTGRNTIAPLHIRNQKFNRKVSRIRVIPNINEKRHITGIRLEKGTAPSNFINIGNDSELAQITKIVFNVLNNYLSKTSDQSISKYPIYTNIFDNQVFNWILIITTAPQSNRHRIQQTQFSFKQERRGGFRKTRKSIKVRP